MNGVRRLLGGPTLHLRTPSPPAPINIEQQPLVIPTTPLIISNKPSWPPSPLQENKPRSDTQATFHCPIRSPGSKNSASQSVAIREDRFCDSTDEFNPAYGTSIYPAVSPGSNDYKPFLTAGPSYSKSSTPQYDSIHRSSAGSFEGHLKRQNHLVSIRDELYMMLLASQAIVDSTDAEILTAEEVETLKKEYQLLRDRQNSLALRFSLETKIRDAAISLSKVNVSHKGLLKQTSEQLETATRKVETTQTELRRVSERANTVQCRLLEHRSGVLSVSLQSLESFSTTDEPYANLSIRSSNKSPLYSIKSASTSSRMKFDGPHFFAGHACAITINPQHTRLSDDEFVNLEAKLKASSDKIKALTSQIVESGGMLIQLCNDKEDSEGLPLAQLSAAEKQLLNLQEELKELHTFKQDMEELRKSRFGSEADRAGLLEKRDAVEQLELQLDVIKVKTNESFAIEDFVSRALEQSRMELQDRDSEIEQLKARIVKISTDLNTQKRSKEQGDTLRSNIEEDLRRSLDKCEVLARNLEEAQRERETAQHAAEVGDSQLQISTANFEDGNSDIKRWYKILLPVWNALPSPEARALKLGFRKLSPIVSPSSPPKSFSSLSDADVKNLKMLYDSRATILDANQNSLFTIEAFAARVQAVIADDRALIERLVRFAQAHELLKKNAERAQKLAQESSIALETYQQQVKELEDRNMYLASGQAELQEEIQQLQALAARLTVEKDEIEKYASMEAEKSRQLSEANDKLSARALALAEEAATAPEDLKKQLEAQLSDCMAELQQVQSEVESMRNSEHSQRITLLDEINTVQTENLNLRAQLRLAKK